MSKTIILIDEPIEFDNRVQHALKAYTNYILEDCSDNQYFRFFYIIPNLILLFNSVSLNRVYWKLLKKKYNIQPQGIFSGLKSSLRIRCLAKKKAYELEKKYSGEAISIIYANDLRCGIIGAHLAKKFGAKLVYDSHELSFHRNRKNGKLRVVFDILTEKAVTKKASKVKVVNKHMKEIFSFIYKIPLETIEIVNNAFYEPFIGYALENFIPNQGCAIIYIGAGYKGRMLEDLTTSKEEITLYGYFLDELPGFTKKSRWKLGSKNYLSELLELIKSKKLCMWVCTENKCLSYRFSLGNKFFQAIAIGIPVVASEGTYLADIVRRYGLGYIYNGANLRNILDSLEDDSQYKSILQSVRKFQTKFFQNSLVL